MTQNKKYNEVVKKLQHYIINENYIKSIKDIILQKNRAKILHKSKKNEIKNDLYCPKEHDKLYWMIYIMKHGIIDYEYNKNKRFLLEKEDKIQYIEQIKNHKEIIKKNKLMTISEFENNLMNDKIININTFLNICGIENKNVVFIRNKLYYELLTTDNDEVFLIHNIKNKHNSKFENYTFEKCKKNDKKWKEITSNYIQTNNILNPIKSISYYKLEDLILMSEKFGLSIFKEGENKKKTKKDLYEQIIHHIS